MSYTIHAKDCTNCGLCEPDCPVDAISEQGGVRVIDPDICIECGACFDICPDDAITEPE